MPDDPIVIYALLGLLCGLVGAAIGSAKSRAGFGFFLGLVLGPLGCIIIAVLPGERRRDFMEAISARPGTAQPSSADAISALLDLKKLLDAGAVTEAEYSDKKKLLLDQIGAAPKPSYRIPGIN